MSQSWITRARLLTKRVFGTNKSTSRPQQAARTRPGLEALEDRNMLSVTGSEPLASSAVLEVGRYAVQEVRNYISSYESTVVTAQQMLANLEQKAILDFAYVESTVQQMVQQFERQISNSTSAGASGGQSTSVNPQQPGVPESVALISSGGSPSTNGDRIASAGGASPASNSEEPSNSNNVQTSQAPGINLGTQFPGLGQDSYYPPDTNAAVGPNCVIEVVNQSIAIYDKTGTLLSSESLQAFFGIGSNYATDPVVVYDDQAGRFVVTDDQLNKSTGQAQLLLAVSNTNSPTNLSTDFTEKQSINVTETNGSGQTLWPDQPQLGWNADAYVVSMNMYTTPVSSPSFDHVQLLTIQKSSVLDQNPSTLTDYRVDYSGTAFSLAPARMHGSVSGDPMWLVDADSTDSGLDVVKMTNVLSANPTFAVSDVPTVQSNGTFSAPEPGTTGTLDTGDGRVNGPDWRNGMLVAAQGFMTANEDETKVHWSEINTSGTAPTLVQQGTIDPGSGVAAFNPSIAIDPNGDLGMTYLQSSSTQYLSMYITGRASSDASGTMETPTEVYAGQATYTDGSNPYRTGGL